VVVLPSESSTIADGGFLPPPLPPVACLIAWSATASASPVAVAPSGNWALMIWRTGSRSVVGVWTASGEVE
jgi:hypothetical protein